MMPSPGKTLEVWSIHDEDHSDHLRVRFKGDSRGALARRVVSEFRPTFVGAAARIRPTTQMWDSSLPIFEETVKTLQPERILVLGIQNWRNVLRLVPHQTHGEYQANFLVGRINPLAGYVQHPSSSLKYSEWYPVAQDLLFK
jgi:hypothetical protein